MSNPEELLTQILKANKKIAFGQTIGTDADGNCTVQTDDGSILARSPDQISAGSCVALKTDDGQWYAVSARQSGSIQKKTLFKSIRKPSNQEEDVATIFASLGFVGIAKLGGTEDLYFDGRESLGTGGLMQYRYNEDNLDFIEKGDFDLDASIVVPPSPVGTSFDLDFSDDNNSVTYTYPTEAGGLLAEFLVFFPNTPEKDPPDPWNEIIEPWKGFYYGEDFYTAPIEVEMILNQPEITILPSLIIGTGSGLTIGYDYIAADCQLLSQVSPVTFSFRWRRRAAEGEDPLEWFQL